jgi:type IV pilus assembly protein PilM
VRSGSILDLHVIPHGSHENTKRLEQALSLSFITAEETKRTFGFLGDKSNPYIKEVMQLSSYPLFGEVARLLLMYERKYNQSIEGVVVSGGGARVHGVVEAMQESIKIPVRLATPFDQVEIPSFLRELVHSIGPSYAIACGLALKKLQTS